MRFASRPLVTHLIGVPFLLAGASACRAQSTADPSSVAPQSVAPISAPSQSVPGAVEQRQRKRFLPLFGPDVEYSYFLGEKTRSRFGSTIFSIGPGIGDETPSLKGEFGSDFSITSAKNRQNGFESKLFLVSVGPEYKRVYIPPQVKRAMAAARSATATGAPPEMGTQGPPPFLPYYGASANILYARIKSPLDGVDGSGLGAGGSVFVGLSIRSRAFIETRLRATTPIKNFNFSSVGLSLGLRF